jgi:hypothetical protein
MPNADFDDQTIPIAYRPDACPHCGGDRIAVLYWRPGIEVMKVYGSAVDAERVLLGGCIIPAISPARYCKVCNRGIASAGRPVRRNPSFRWVADDVADDAPEA